jgi:hypothetical protein
MNTFSRTILYELEEKINKISYDYDNPIDMCDKSIEEVVYHLKQLKDYVLANQFETQEDEIKFFKHTKPKFLSKLIYFKKIRKLETRKPVGSEKKQRKYLNKELNKLNIFFSENIDFYNYYRLGSNFLDHKIFIRGDIEINYNLEIFYYEMDHRFSTTHDFKAATILSNEIFQKYIENKIRNLSDNKAVEIKPIMEKPVLKWTESKTSLIELLYALHTQKAFNNGKADIVDIAKHFEKIFDIELGDFYRVWNEIKNRKINKTKFLDTLKENLNKRSEEQDSK